MTHLSRLFTQGHHYSILFEKRSDEQLTPVVSTSGRLFLILKLIILYKKKGLKMSFVIVIRNINL